MVKCKCGNKGIYYQKYSNKYLCRECFINDVERRVKKTLGRNILKRNTKIIIGLSGGKDSIVMTYILKKLFKDIPDTKIDAIFIDEGIKGFRDKARKIITEFCKNEEINLKIISFDKELGIKLDDIVPNLDKLNIGKPCSFCGVVRRYLLNKYSQGYDYLAIGHNLDDFAQTILMNYIEGNIKNLIQFGKTTEGFVKRIKPLKLIPEEEVKLYADLLNLPYQKEPCPYSSISYRNKIKNILSILEKDKPGVKFSILKGYEKLLSIIDYNEKINRCKICGYPCSGEICRVCQWLKMLKVR